MMMNAIVFLIPLFPLLGFLVLGAGIRVIPRKVTALLAPGMILLSLISTLVLFIGFHPSTASQVHQLFSWIRIGPLDIPFAFLIDPLSILMLLIVTGIGFVIHVYSVGYMKEDPGFNRFFSYMNLFVFSMLLLVM